MLLGKESPHAGSNEKALPRGGQSHFSQLPTPNVRIDPDEPGGPGSDWGVSKILAISLSIAAILILPLFVCLVRRCILNARRSKQEKKVAESRAEALIEARAIAAREAAEAGDHERSRALEVQVERARAERAALSSGQQPTGDRFDHKTANLLDAYMDDPEAQLPPASSVPNASPPRAPAAEQGLYHQTGAVEPYTIPRNIEEFDSGDSGDSGGRVPSAAPRPPPQQAPRQVFAVDTRLVSAAAFDEPHQDYARRR